MEVNMFMYYLRKIGKIFSYLPVLWKDEDWDADFIFPILEFKLKRLKKCLKNGYMVPEDAEKTQKEIQRAIELARLIYIDDYCEKEYDKLGGIENYDLTAEISEDDTKDILRISLLEGERKSAAYEEFFGLLRDKSRRWWD